MAPSKRTAVVAVGLFIVLAFASLGVALREHDADSQAAGHADCNACHLRHVSGITPDATPAPSAPDLVTRAVVANRPDSERPAALGILPTRGPPA